MWSHPDVFSATLRLRMAAANSERVAAALKRVVAAAESEGFEVEDAQTALGGGDVIRSGESARQLGEDRQVGMEPHPLDSSHAEREQRPLIL